MSIRTPINEVRGVNQRVVVAPLNLGLKLPAELEDQGEPVWNELLRYLRTGEGRVSAIDGAEDLWSELMLEGSVGDIAPNLHSVSAEFARRLAAESSFDLLVMPSLVIRKARVHGRIASWDGVRRPMPTRSPIPFGSLPELEGRLQIRGLRGQVAAASLHVMVLDPNGRSIYDGLAGLDVIHEADRDPTRGKPWTLALRPEPFSVPQHLREGIERAFQRPVRSTAVSW